MKHVYGELIINDGKPKISRIFCLVPDCGKYWHLEGSNQGFMRHAGSEHCHAHWNKHHIAQKHKGIYSKCKQCEKTAEKTWKKIPDDLGKQPLPLFYGRRFGGAE